MHALEVRRLARPAAVAPDDLAGEGLVAEDLVARAPSRSGSSSGRRGRPPSRAARGARASPRGARRAPRATRRDRASRSSNAGTRRRAAPRGAPALRSQARCSRFVKNGGSRYASVTAPAQSAASPRRQPGCRPRGGARSRSGSSRCAPAPSPSIPPRRGRVPCHPKKVLTARDRASPRIVTRSAPAGRVERVGLSRRAPTVPSSRARSS